MKEKRILQKHEINLVGSRFQRTVKEAWKRGEEVPFGVTYLSSEMPNAADIEWAMKHFSLKEQLKP